MYIKNNVMYYNRNIYNVGFLNGQKCAHMYLPEGRG